MNRSTNQTFRNRFVAIIGMGLSGCSAAKLLLAHGARVIGLDKRAQILKEDPSISSLLATGLQLQVDSDPIDFTSIDLVVLSPGVPQTHAVVQEAQRKGIEIIGEIELASRFITQKCIGITGTNGKTTVTLLVEHVLCNSGYPAKALGNVEIPLGAALVEQDLSDKILVLELSSFQLDTLHAPILDVAVLLNITPDHLDRYESMDAYARSKMHIGDCVKPGGVLFIEEQALTDFRALLPQAPIKTYGYASTCDYEIGQKEIKCKGKTLYALPQAFWEKKSHDIENQVAAFALCQMIGVTPEQFIKALATFKKPSHRVEFVRTFNEVSFYDDSKGTNVDAVIRAVHTLSGGVILIAGGVDKGAPYTPWIGAFGDRVKGICAIGQAAQKIKEELSIQIPVKLCSDLQEAVIEAARWAKTGENVLLSPGCSSYDMFRDYKHRGEEFQRFVQQL